MNNEEKCCGTCYWHKKCCGEFQCFNESADGYALETERDKNGRKNQIIRMRIMERILW